MPASRRPVLVNVSVADIRREPAHASEMVTQAILGTRLRLLEARDEERWYHVQLPDGYRGWVRSWLVAPAPSAWPGERVAEVDAPIAWLRSKPEPESDPVSDLVMGTRLPIQAGAPRGWTRLALPDGRQGFLEREHLLGGASRLPPAGRRPATATAILATARRFIGVPYVWGGKSPKGFDCSGLTQYVLELHGVPLPRDSRDQRSFLERRVRPAVDPFQVPPSGLLFFGSQPGATSHVAFSMGAGLFIHAQGRVRIQSLVPGNMLYHRELAGLFQVGCKVPGVRASIRTRVDRS